MIGLFFLFLLGLLMLLGGAEILVRGATSMGLRLGVTPLIAGLTIVAFGTSAPELIVGVDAALEGLGDVAIGGAVGSNICNIALVLGIAALIRPIDIQSQLVKKDIPIMVGASILLVVLLIDRDISRVDGVILVAGILLYTVFSIRNARREPDDVILEFEQGVPTRQLPRFVELALVAGGLGLLVGGGTIVVQNAVEIAHRLHVSPAIIALTVIAVGTSLPELATAAIASFRRQGDIAIGNVVGSNIFNIFAIVGISATIVPLNMGGIDWTDMLAMVVVSLLLVPLVLSRRRLERWEGLLLVLFYFAYLYATVNDFDIVPVPEII